MTEMDRTAQPSAIGSETERLRARIVELESECCALRARLGDSGPEVLAGPEAQSADPRPSPCRSNDHFALFADALPTGIAYIDESRRYRYVNRTYAGWIGCEIGRICGATVTEVVGADASAEIVPQLARAGAGDAVELEHDLRHRDGGRRRIKSSYVPDLDRSGQPRGIIEIASDLTEFRETEAELRNRQGLYATAAEMARLGHFVWDEIEQRSIYCSEELARITCMSVESYLSTFSSYDALLRMVHPGDRERFDAVLTRAFEEKSAYELDFRVVLPNGTQRHFREHGEPVLDQNGTVVRTIGIQQDITELKAAESTLHAGEQRFKDFAAVSAHWFWETGPDLRFTYVSEGIVRITGERPEDFIGKRREDLAGSSPADTAALEANLAQMLRHEPFDDLIYSRLRRDGEEVHLAINGKPIFSEEGAFLGYRGTGRDVTALQTAQRILARTDALFRETERLARLGHWEWDEVADRCAFCSEELARLHGVTVAEFIELASSTEGDLSFVHPDDRERYAEAVAVARRDCTALHIEYRLQARDGVIREVREVGKFVVDDRGRPLRSFGFVQDIADRKRAEGAVRASEARFRDFAESASDWFWETDVEHRVTWISDRLEQVLGFSPTEVIGQTRWGFQGSDPDQDPQWQAHQELLEARQPFYDFEYVHERDGQAFHLAVSGRPVFGQDGVFLGYRGTARDITERKLAELALRRTKKDLDERVRQRTAELRETNEILVKEIKIRKQAEAAAEQSREVMAQAVESLDQGFVIFDANERMVLCNSKYREIYRSIGAELFKPGTTLEQVARGTAEHCIGLTRDADVETWVRRRLEQHRSGSWPRIHRHVDGRWIRTGESLLPNGWNVGTRTDVTELKNHELDLAEQAKSIGLLQRIGTALGEASDVQAGIQACLEEVCAHCCWSVGQAYLLEAEGSEQLTLSDAWHGVEPDRLAALRHALGKTALAPDQGLPARVLADGAPRQTLDLGSDPRFAAGPDPATLGLRWACAFPVAVGAKVAIVLEFLAEQPTELDDKLGRTMVSLGEQLGRMVERKRAEEAVKHSEQQLRQVIEVVPLMIFAKSADGRFTLANQAVAETLGTTVDDLVGKTLREVLDQDQDFEGFLTADQAIISGQVPELVSEGELVDPRGNRRILRTIKVPFKQSGYESTVALGVAMDVTEQREQERQLQQAQKMDAVGKLTGGVAHDFNNLLFVIQGNLQLLEEEVAESEEVAQLVEAIKRAAGMGADLTRSLLAFSRQQPLKPERLDLSPVIEGSIALLRRTLSEDIVIEPRFEESTWPVLIDRFQLENAIINLAVNARDAMVDGGTLGLAVGNSRVKAGKAARAGKGGSGPTPGDYVRIEVSDTGSGMPQEVIERAFEPFFTTKRAGSGTGLGLSMVYGFVNQSGGHIEIRSTEGRGTSVTILLPRASESAARSDEVGLEGEGCEPERATILVTEDDREVRRVAVRILKKLGYETLEAGDGHEALELLEFSPQVSLLFTDVIMPGGMNGRQLAEEAQRRHPDLKVLFSSGYSESAIIRDGKLEDGVELVAKPYQRDELARRIRQILQGKSGT